MSHDPFYDLPLNELDILTLTETTYLSFDNLVSTTPMRLLDLAPQVPRESNMLTSKIASSLLDELAQHKRFKIANSPILLMTSTLAAKQFAAMTFRLNLDTYLIVFVGLMTVSLAGRKISTRPIRGSPAQKHALRYLKNFCPPS